MTKEEAWKIIADAAAFRDRLSQFDDPLFPKQTDYINDTSKQISLLTTRRGGKSFGDGKLMYKGCLEEPNVNTLYIALTRASAKAIMFNDVLKVINKQFKLGATFNETELTFKLPNGSMGFLLGVDAKPDEAEKILGRKFKKVIVDEGGSFHQDLRHIVYKIVRPTLVDLNGQLYMSGTPTNMIHGLFHDITTGLEPGWKRHFWTTYDNPYMKTKWEAEINDLINKDPNVVNSAWFKQMYLGQWEIETDKLVYKFNTQKNIIASIPQQDYYYVLGIDLGWTDDSAFTVGAYSMHDKHLYILESYKKPEMTLTDVQEKIKELRRKYSISKFVIDGANKQAVEEMRLRTNIPFEATDKRDKNNFIEIMNNDFVNGSIKVLQGKCDPLVDEWNSLIWEVDEVSGKREENKGCPNHGADSALYLHRYCYQYLSTPKTEKPKIDTPEYMDELSDKEDEMWQDSKKLSWIDKL